MNIASYEKYILGLATVLSNNIGTNQYANVSDLSDNIFKNGEIFIVQGRLSNVTKLISDDISYIESANLIDSTGSREVILFQNSFTDTELYEDRIHYIFYDEKESSYVVLYSPKNEKTVGVGRNLSLPNYYHKKI